MDRSSRSASQKAPTRGRRPYRPDRSSPLQGGARRGGCQERQDQANLANAPPTCRQSVGGKQSAATQQQLDTQQSLVNQLTATVAADAAAIDAAQVQLNYTTVRAPISGRAGLRLIDEGNMVSAAQQTGIVTLSQIEPIAAIFTRRRTICLRSPRR